MSASPITLDAAALQSAAMDAAGGLHDFGDDSFRPGLEQLCNALNHEARLSDIGVGALQQKIVAQLANRLRMEAHIRQHPEILDEVIAAPLIIVGLPRTGTTKLHRLLSRDPRFWWMAFWESQMPVPLPGETPQDPTPRRQQGQAIVDMMTGAMPDLAAIHPMANDEADEEFMLMEHSFLSDFNAYAHVPSYMQWLSLQDERPAYALLRRMLQFLQWQKRQRGIEAQRWVLKAPHHLHRMALLLDAFPDAQLVQTHRDPATSIPSIASFIHTLHRIYSTQSDPSVVGADWCARMHGGLYATMQLRQQPPHRHRFLDVAFEDTVARPLQVVERIYDFIGWTLDDATRASMATWLEEDNREHARNAGAHRYSPEAFGFTTDGLRDRFADYIGRHIADGPAG